MQNPLCPFRALSAEPTENGEQEEREKIRWMDIRNREHRPEPRLILRISLIHPLEQPVLQSPQVAPSLFYCHWC